MTTINDSQELSRLAEAIADVIAKANVVPAAAIEFRALFKEQVEKISSDGPAIYVCPHSQISERISRSTYLRILAVDVEIQYKLRAGETQEDVVKTFGGYADKVHRLLYDLNVGPYKQRSCDYFPFHGESLDQSRTFVSIISCKYQGLATVPRRKTV